MDQGLADSPKPRRRRSGSERRRKARRITYRVSDDDYQKIEEAASTAGLSVASYSRSRAVDAPASRARHCAPVDAATFRTALRAFTKVAVNINQIARHLNMDGIVMPEELAVAGKRIDASRVEVMAAMRGRT